MNKLKFLLMSLFITTISIYPVFGQLQDDKPLFNNEVERPYFTGGNFGLQFGSVTAIDVSPILGYRIKENLALGIGATYQYFRDGSYKPTISMDVYGGRLFARYYFLSYFFLHGEYELINHKKVNIIQGYSVVTNDRVWENNLYLGGGYRQLLGEFSSMHISALWNFNQGPYSPYSNPLIRIGFDIQL